jgi:hypothetical protein
LARSASFKYTLSASKNLSNSSIRSWSSSAAARMAALYQRM